MALDLDRLSSTARLLALSTHPGPSVAVTVLSIVLGAAVGISAPRVALLGLAVMLGQLSIGLSNDWIDAERDAAVGRTDKPVAQGLVPLGLVRGAALTTAALTVVASLALGVEAGIAHVVFVASGWLYNAAFKRTPVSVLPFMLSFGLLPAVVTLALPTPQWPAWWALAVGAIFGISIHFTNVLPDLDDDARTGIAGLPHRLGRVRSGVVAFGALALAAVLLLVGPVLTGGGGVSVLAVVGLVASVAIAATGVVLVLTRPPGRLLFRLVIVASLLIAAQLVLSGTELVAG
ncbi:membrane protein [Flavimobilis marinus]|uniref:4-hydroxybenzoate polyprenyltransferase n=1 Tax=Flavimobilis marinus TaxID=285351 RepID=A0A1I2FL13_9MICO|nr:UbiA family prenyltransferase [Flavimobilis marinus]GHG51936.1 membrane protein [Flavimobilis marinus]SFF05206.1 4-hydroxybenzoate polyprenyltransferase [Flavimobilis marinus]